jgi:predicted transcriptional regulator
MQSKSMKDVLKSQEEFTEKLNQQWEAICKGKIPSAEVLREDKQRLLEQYKTRLKSTIDAKKAAENRFDKQIRRYKDVVAQLEKELAAESEVLDASLKKGGQKGPLKKKASLKRKGKSQS